MSFFTRRRKNSHSPSPNHRHRCSKSQEEPPPPAGAASSSSSESNQKQNHPSSTATFLHRRHTATTSTTILPITQMDATAVGSSRTSPSGGSNATTTKQNYQYPPVANNFLLGGMYDKRRRTRKSRNTFWNIGKSWMYQSPAIVVTVTIIICCVSVSYILIPILITTKHHGGIDWLLVDTTTLNHHHHLHHGSIPEQRASVEQLAIERELVRKQDKQTRLQILEHLASGWYHRNDFPPIITSSGSEKQDANNHDSMTRSDKKQPKPKQAAKTKSDRNEPDRRKASDASIIHHDQKGMEHAAVTSGRDNHGDTVMKRPSVLVQEYPSAVVEHFQQQHNEEEDRHVHHHRLQWRTLHTMDTMISNNSHCPANLDESNISTTLVIQSSLDRVWVLEETCRRWNDPIVAVVTVTGEEHRLGLGSSLSGWKDKCPQLELIVYQLDEETEVSPEQYPINVLRNMALDLVETSHILVLDVDFVPSQNLHETIRSVLLQNLWKSKDDTTDANYAVVVPAFERVLLEPCTSDADCKQHLRMDSSFIPHTFEDLKRCYESKGCIVFQSKNNWDGHSSTRSLEWLNRRWYDDDAIEEINKKGNDTQMIRSIECFDSLRYEPYVAIRWCPTGKQASATQATNVKSELDYANASDAMNNRKHDLQTVARPIAPYYDERFHGYGKNKIQHISHLRILGYKFRVLPEGFIVHNPHLESKVKETWNDMKASTLHREMDELYEKYLKELVDKYIKGSEQMPQSIVGPCKRLK